MLTISNNSFISLVTHEYDEKIKAGANNVARKSELYNICKVVTKDKKNIDFIFELSIQITNGYKHTQAKDYITIK